MPGWVLGCLLGVLLYCYAFGYGEGWDAWAALLGFWPWWVLLVVAGAAVLIGICWSCGEFVDGWALAWPEMNLRV